MTSGVSRSRSLPFSAMGGETKTSAITAMQTLHTHSMSIGNTSAKRTAVGEPGGRLVRLDVVNRNAPLEPAIIARGVSIRIHAQDSDGVRKSEKICQGKARCNSGRAIFHRK